MTDARHAHLKWQIAHRRCTSLLNVMDWVVASAMAFPELDEDSDAVFDEYSQMRDLIRPVLIMLARRASQEEERNGTQK